MKRDLSQDLQQIQTHLGNGRFTAGITLCREVLTYAPNDPNALYLLGLGAAQLGDATTTREAFYAAWQITPERVDLLINFGNFLRETGEPLKALPLLEKASVLSPQMPGVWKALAVTQFKLNRFEAALASAEKLVGLAPQEATGWELAAGAAQQLRDFDKAAALVARGLTHLPQSASLNYAMGQLHREQGSFEEASAAYLRAQELGFSSADLYRNNAEALLETGKALDAVAFARRGLEHYSTDIALQQVVTRLHVETNAPGDPVGDLMTAAREHRTNAALWEAAVGFLKHLDRHEEANRLVGEALLSGCPKTSGLMSLEAIALADQGFLEQMTRSYERLLRDYPTDAGIKFDFAVQLLKTADPSRAGRLLADVLKVNPLDQLALAFRCAALRAAGDERLSSLIDYEQMIFEVEVPAPYGYGSSAAYFQEVATTLEALHHTHSHPIDQSVRGGTQTNGFLFRIADPLVKSLEQQIRVAVCEVLSTFPRDPGHPFWGRHVAGTGASDVLFSGAWSVRLRTQGHHTNHVHPKGWISSALYISVPDEVAKGTDEAGFIQFGAPEEKLGLNLAPVRTIRPVVGSLVLFPSYLWHGTIPFTSDQSRISVAFDIVPHR
jgi:tetratricopeptide (TPR) repeat protein